MVLEVFLTTVFTLCLTSVVSPRSPTSLWVPWGEGKCRLHLWPHLTYTEWLSKGQIPCLLFCWAESLWHGFHQPSSPSPGVPPALLTWISPPVPQEGVSFSNCLSGYYSQGHRGVHQALGTQWLSYIVLFKNLKNVALKRKITGSETQRSTGSKISVRQTNLKPTILSSPLNVKFSIDY